MKLLLATALIFLYGTIIVLGTQVYAIAFILIMMCIIVYLILKNTEQLE